jgi:hypothetical protein
MRTSIFVVAVIASATPALADFDHYEACQRLAVQSLKLV